LPADLSPHDLRRTALTDLAAHGEAKAVQGIAGHADIDTTMRLYARRRMTAMRAAVEEMEKGRKTG
jgi:integrase